MKINREELLAALTAVQPALAKTLVAEHSMSFIFIDNMVCTFNNELAVSHPIEVDFEGAVPGKEFYDLVRRLKTEEIELVEEEGHIRVKSGRSNAGLRLEEASLPLEELGMPDDEDYTDLPEKFIAAVEACLFSIGRDINKPILSYIHVHNASVTSSDNYRITRFDMGKKAAKTFPDALLISAVAAKSIVEYKPIEYALTDGWIHFRNDDGALFSCRRVLEETYPDFTKFLSVKGAEIEFPSDLDEILDRALVMCNDQRVKVKIEKNKLTVATESDNGWFKEQTRIKYEGASNEFYMHPKFMRDTLKLNQKAVIGAALKFTNDSFQHVVRLIPTDEK